MMAPGACLVDGRGAAIRKRHPHRNGSIVAATELGLDAKASSSIGYAGSDDVRCGVVDRNLELEKVIARNSSCLLECAECLVRRQANEEDVDIAGQACAAEAHMKRERTLQMQAIPEHLFEPRQVALEDAQLALAIYRHGGLRCLDLDSHLQRLTKSLRRSVARHRLSSHCYGSDVVRGHESPFEALGDRLSH